MWFSDSMYSLILFLPFSMPHTKNLIEASLALIEAWVSDSLEFIGMSTFLFNFNSGMSNIVLKWLNFCINLKFKILCHLPLLRWRRRMWIRRTLECWRWWRRWRRGGGTSRVSSGWRQSRSWPACSPMDCARPRTWSCKIKSDSSSLTLGHQSTRAFHQCK